MTLAQILLSPVALAALILAFSCVLALLAASIRE